MKWVALAWFLLTLWCYGAGTYANYQKPNDLIADCIATLMFAALYVGDELRAIRKAIEASKQP